MRFDTLLDLGLAGRMKCIDVRTSYADIRILLATNCINSPASQNTIVALATCDIVDCCAAHD